MTTAKSIIHAFIILTLLGVGICLIFSTEDATDATTLIARAIADKLAGFLCLFVCCRLYRVWSKSDRWIRAYDRWNTPHRR